MRPLTVLALLLLAAASAHATEWPQFHADPLHSGAVVSDFAAPKERWWSQSTGGAIEGSPVVSDGRVFVGSTDGKLYAFDAISGSPLWTFDTGGPITSTPALSGGILYVVNNAGDIYAIDAVTGKKRLSDGAARESPGQSRTNPAIHEGRLYLGTESGAVIAYNLQTLSKDWEFKTFGEQEAFNIQGSPSNTGSYGCRERFKAVPVRSSPAVYNDIVFFGSDAHALFAVNEFGLGGSRAGQTTGVWTWPAGATSTYTCADPSPVGGTSQNVSLKQSQYFPRHDDVIRASPAIDAANNLVVVASYDNNITAYDVLTGVQKWRTNVSMNNRDSRVISTPAVTGDRVYFGSFNGHFYALEHVKSGTAVTGVKKLWSFETNGAIWSSPALSNGLVAFGSDDETIYVLDAATGEKKWSTRVGGDVRSSPAIWTGEVLGTKLNGGVLYVGSSDGILYAFGGDKPALPDLKVAAIEHPDPLPLDADVEVKVTVTNAGNSSSPATELKLFIDDALASTQPVKALGPGENATVVYVWKVTSGDHELLAVADPAGLSREFDRSNNELLVKTPVAQVPAPPQEEQQEQQEQAPPPKKKSPGVEGLALAAAAGLVALAARRRTRAR